MNLFNQKKRVLPFILLTSSAIIVYFIAIYIIHYSVARKNILDNVKPILKNRRLENIFIESKYKIDSNKYSLVDKDDENEYNYSDSIETMFKIVESRENIRFIFKPTLSESFIDAVKDTNISDLSKILVFYTFFFHYSCDTLYYSGNSNSLQLWWVKKKMILYENIMNNSRQIKILRLVENKNAAG